MDGLYYVLAGTNEAITFASQLAKVESLRDKDSFSDLIRGLYLYGAKTVQPKALAKMVVEAPESSIPEIDSDSDSDNDTDTDADSDNDV